MFSWDVSIKTTTTKSEPCCWSHTSECAVMTRTEQLVAASSHKSETTTQDVPQRTIKPFTQKTSRGNWEVPHTVSSTYTDNAMVDIYSLITHRVIWHILDTHTAILLIFIMNDILYYIIFDIWCYIAILYCILC